LIEAEGEVSHPDYVTIVQDALQLYPLPVEEGSMQAAVNQQETLRSPEYVSMSTRNIFVMNGNI